MCVCVSSVERKSLPQDPHSLSAGVPSEWHHVRGIPAVHTASAKENKEYGEGTEMYCVGIQKMFRRIAKVNTNICQRNAKASSGTQKLSVRKLKILFL